MKKIIIFAPDRKTFLFCDLHTFSFYHLKTTQESNENKYICKRNEQQCSIVWLIKREEGISVRGAFYIFIISIHRCYYENPGQCPFFGNEGTGKVYRLHDNITFLLK